MDNFLDIQKIPKLNWYQRDHLNNPTTLKEIEVVIENLPNKQNKETNKQKRTGPDGFSAEFYQIFKEGLSTILLILFHKIQTEGTLHNSFYEATIMLKTKPFKDQAK